MAKVVPIGLVTLLLAACLPRGQRADVERDQSLGAPASLEGSVPVGAPAAEPGADEATAPRPLGIDLTVTDLAGEPIRELRLSLDRAVDGDAVESKDLALKSDDGHFTASVAVAGNWSLWPEVYGERLLNADRTPWLGPIDVSRAEPLALVLLRPGKISGKVVDGDGRAVADAEIEITLVTPSDDDPDFGTTGFSSDEAGAFVIDRALATVGDERLVLIARQVDGASVAQCELALDPGSHVDSVVLAFEGTRSVAGVVLDVAGKPFPSVSVELYPLDSACEFPLSCEADEDGRFELLAVPAERFRVVVDYALAYAMLDEDPTTDELSEFQGLVVAPVDCRQGSQRELTLRPVPLTGQLVSGVLTDAKGPADSRHLIFVREGSDFLQGQRMAVSAADGTFEVRLTEGLYSVFTVRPDSGLVAEAVELGLVDVPPANARLELRIPSGAISGRVVGSDGESASEFLLVAHRSGVAGAEGLPLSIARIANADADGRFCFEELEAGHWTINSLFFGGEEVVVVADTIELATNERREGMQLECAPTIPLRVELINALPEQRTHLFVRRPDGQMVVPFALDASQDPDAPLRLPASKVQVIALQGVLASAWSPEIDLQPGAPASIKLSLRAAGTVSVTCTRDAAGPPKAIRLYDAVGEVSAIRSMSLATVMTQERGAYRRRFGPLPPGVYRAEVEAADGREVERSFTLGAGEALELTLDH